MDEVGVRVVADAAEAQATHELTQGLGLYAAKAEGRDRTKLAAEMPDSAAGQPGTSARDRKRPLFGVGA